MHGPMFLGTPDNSLGLLLSDYTSSSLSKCSTILKVPEGKKKHTSALLASFRGCLSTVDFFNREVGLEGNSRDYLAQPLSTIMFLLH